MYGGKGVCVVNWVVLAILSVCKLEAVKKKSNVIVVLFGKKVWGEWYQLFFWTPVMSSFCLALQLISAQIALTW